ncbi:MAG: metal ABC transporter permease [Arcanobacterium sp.]|nr:metal ABC transporter permease [Arcanobacterium sp.]
MSISWELLTLPIVEAVVIGVLGGVVGAVAFAHKRIFFTESLTHATFPGAVLGVVVVAGATQIFAGERANFTALHMAILLGAVALCGLMIGLMHWLASFPQLSSQSAAGIVLTFGFALGYFLNKWFAPLPVKVDSFLVGSLLNVGVADVVAAAVVLAIAIVVVAYGGGRLAFYSFDPIGYRASGLSVGLAEMIILGLITLAVVVLVPGVGTILPIALIAGPAAAAAKWASTFPTLTIISGIFGALASISGLALGVLWELSVGGMIAICCGACFAISEVCSAARHSWRI